MADRDRPAIHIEPIVRNAELVAAVEHLHGEGLVKLPQADILDRQIEAFQQLGDREYRADAHLIGFRTRHRHTDISAHGCEPPRLGDFRFHQHTRSGTVGKLARIASRDRIALAHDGVELCQPFDSRIGAVAIVHRNGDVLLRHLTRFAVLHVHRSRHFDDLVAELARSLRRRRPLLGLQRIGILILARDAIPFGDHFGSADHRHENIRMHA